MKNLLISRLKVMADLDLTERRLPQDSQVTLKMPGHDRDFRLSIMPSIMGEKVVLRARGPSADKTFPPLSELGFATSNLTLIEKLIKSPDGVLFLTGQPVQEKPPTASTSLTGPN